MIIISGDNLFTSINGMIHIMKFFKENKYDYIKTSGLPIGMNVDGFTLDSLRKGLKKYKDYKELEVYWTIIFKNLNIHKIKLGDYEDTDKDIRVTLDYIDDYHFLNK